jgi:hypothetical protein
MQQEGPSLFGFIASLVSGRDDNLRVSIAALDGIRSAGLCGSQVAPSAGRQWATAGLDKRLTYSYGLLSI